MRNPTTSYLLARVAATFAQLTDEEQVAALRKTPGALRALEQEYDDLRAALIAIRVSPDAQLSLWQQRCIEARLPQHHWFADGKMHSAWR